MEFQHSTHQEHPLLLKDEETATSQSITCGICARSITTTPLYSCDSCRYYLHKSCAELPNLLNHPFHPSHPLNLRTHIRHRCESCHRLFYNNARAFVCVQCNFTVDIECAMMPPITFTGVEQRNIIQHFSHQHKLPLVKIDSKDAINCFGCQTTICSDDRVYGCTVCKYFLHESCAEFPKEFSYPFHLEHGLLAIYKNFLIPLHRHFAVWNATSKSVHALRTIAI
ncbi:C1-like [Trema orientale]|uniref:C1-like n=1 Tax=Trema orientale TaxID=63057 RepID=A0A2P5CGV8_TREOI|nr:C1-like [Trema orientale]